MNRTLGRLQPPRYVFLAWAIVLLAVLISAPWVSHSAIAQGKKTMSEVRFMTLDPGHFHAGLVQKEMYPNVSKRVHVYAPLGTDLLEHLNRIVAFNTRARRIPPPGSSRFTPAPTRSSGCCASGRAMSWSSPGATGARSTRSKPRSKPDSTCWRTSPGSSIRPTFPKLESALDTAESQGPDRLRHHDRALRNHDHAPEGADPRPGHFRDHLPGHGGRSLRLHGERAPPAQNGRGHAQPPARPGSSTSQQQGEALPDVGTHLVDLVQWMLFPEQPIDYRKDVRMLAAKRWATVLTKARVPESHGRGGVSGLSESQVKADRLEYFCNGRVSYALRGVHIRLTRCGSMSPCPGPAIRTSPMSGARGPKSKFARARRKSTDRRCTWYPTSPPTKAAVLAALKKKVAALQSL